MIIWTEYSTDRAVQLLHPKSWCGGLGRRTQVCCDECNKNDEHKNVTDICVECSEKCSHENNSLLASNEAVENEPKKLKRRCHICPSSRGRRSKTCCGKCKKNVCGEHSNTTLKCMKCSIEHPHGNSSTDSIWIFPLQIIIFIPFLNCDHTIHLKN